MTRSRLIALALMLLLLFSGSCGSKPEIDDDVAVLETSYGRIVIEFFSRAAPKHVKNFKGLAREGFYDGTRFHRIVKDKGKTMAIQGGDPNTINGDPSTWGMGQPAQRPVEAEISPSLKHERGIVSAARRTDDRNSATSQFFVCLSPQTTFDGQYSIFGRVIEGMNVVDTIARAPTFAPSDRPADPVVVGRAYIVKRNELKQTGP